MKVDSKPPFGALFRRVLLLVLLSAVCSACAASPSSRALHAAERGDESALRDAIASFQRAGTLSNREAAKLARAVADREIRTATGDDARERIHDASPCARELDDSLAARMRTHDAAGAEAALARLESGALAAENGRSFATDEEAHWRAFGVRALTRPEEDDARRRALLDPEPAVRREAVRAAGHSSGAATPATRSALAESARLDPAPIVRTEAVRALAAFGVVDSLASRREVVSTLRDLWTSGDDGLREDIAIAWSDRGIWDAGGRDELFVLVSSEHGPGAIEAASAVLRRQDTDVEIAQAATGQLVRAIGGGPRALRLQALAEAPPDRSELLAAMQRATRDDDLEVQVAALRRVAIAHQAHEKDGGAVATLEALARPGSPVADRARYALASAGDRRIQAWIEEELASPKREERLGAATALAAMGVAARGAPLLADAVPGVRVRAACTILLAERDAR